VSVREGDVAELTITLPAFLDPDADLSEEQLAAVTGGCSDGCSYFEPRRG
jgi:hypothetical protein